MSSPIKCTMRPEQLGWHQRCQKGQARTEAKNAVDFPGNYRKLQIQRCLIKGGRSQQSLGCRYCTCVLLENKNADFYIFLLGLIWYFAYSPTKHTLHRSSDEDRGSAQAWLHPEDKLPGFALQEQEEQAGFLVQPHSSVAHKLQAGRTGLSPCAKHTCTCASPQQPLLLLGLCIPMQLLFPALPTPSGSHEKHVSAQLAAEEGIRKDLN